MSTRNLESYMNSVSRVNLAAEISRLAQIYGDNLNSMSSDGAVSRLFQASARLEAGLCTDDLDPLAVKTALSLHALDESKARLREDGVPYLIIMEITRRVLDRDIENSREIVYKEEE